VIRNKTNFFAVVLFSALGVLAFPHQAKAQGECAPFPKFEFWGDLTHGSVRTYVKDRFDGDWDAYIDKLEKIITGLQGIHERGKGAVIKLKNRRVTPKGTKLDDYLQLSGARLSVVRCLAETAGIKDPRNVATPAAETDAKDTADLPKPVAKRKGYRTYVTLPQSVIAKLREQAARQSLIEGRKVSVNDLIVRSLINSYGGRDE